MMLTIEELRVDFEEAWRKAGALSTAFPMPEWSWDVVRFELMAFLYAQVLRFAQGKGEGVAFLLAESDFQRVQADFLYEVERCVRFDVCAAMQGAVGDDGRVEELLENRYEVYSSQAGMSLRGMVARFVLLVQCSLKDGVGCYSSERADGGMVNPVFIVELDRVMKRFVEEEMPLMLEGLTKRRYFMSVEKRCPWVIKDDVLRFSSLMWTNEGRGQDKGVVVKERGPAVREAERKPESFIEFTCRFRVLFAVIVFSSLCSAIGMKSWFFGGIALVCYIGKLAVALCVPIVLHLLKEERFGVVFSVVVGVVAWVLMAGYGGYLEYELGIGIMVFPVSFVSGATTAWFAFMAYRVMRFSCCQFKYLW